MTELTVDQLAARAGMTVRNVRAYAARGLLPPPRLQGRTGYYGPQHLSRLVLVREMLSEGYTLAAIERTLAGAPAQAGPTALALHRALMAPWLPEEPEETDLETLKARSGVSADDDLLAELEAMGVLERVGRTGLRVLDPTLLSAGLQAVRLGITPAALVAAQSQVTALVEQAAQAYVQMFRDTVWQSFLDEGAPPERWAELSATVEQVQPVAAQALLASFRTAMATAVAEALEANLEQIAEAPPGPAAAAG